MAKRPTQGGFPKGGEPPDPPEEEEEEELENKAPPKQETEEEKKLRLAEEEKTELRQQLKDLQDDLRELRSNREKPKDEKKPKEVDWAEKFYKDPNTAIADLRKEIREEVVGQMRSEYQGAKGEEQFWATFYQEHPDLRDDDDLVRLELQKNRASLGDLPVEKAAAKLADLTRDRILRYGGGNGEKDRKRPFTEGSGSPRPPREERTEEKIVTLSSVLKARAAKRRQGGKATAA